MNTNYRPANPFPPFSSCNLPLPTKAWLCHTFQPGWRGDPGPWPVSAVVYPYDCQGCVPWETQSGVRTPLSCAAQTWDKNTSCLEALFPDFNLCCL